MSSPKIQVEKSPAYRSITVNGILGGGRIGYFELIPFQEESDAQEALGNWMPGSPEIRIKRTIECRLVLDPFTMKAVISWLARELDRYEKVYGKILEPGDTQASKPPRADSVRVT